MNRRPQRSDVRIDYAKYASLFDESGKIHFDPSAFSVFTDATGTYVTVSVGSEASEDTSSFAVKSVDVDSVTFYGGRIRIAGRPSFDLPDTAVTVNGGYEGAPHFVLLQMTVANGPGDARLICSDTDLDDDNTYRYRTIRQVWLDESGNAVIGKDRRPDWNVSSPI